MDDGLKQRLIGAIVLVALAIIFLPSLFNTDSRQRVDLESQIPPEPMDTARPLVVSEPVRPEGISPAPSRDEYYEHLPEDNEAIGSNGSDKDMDEPEVPPEVSQEEAPLTANQTSVVVQLEEAPEPAVMAEAWSVQVGSFQSQDRAKALEKQLLEKSFSAYLRRFNSGDQTVFRVFVGPKLDRKDAVDEQQHLESLLNADTLLVKYKP